MDGFIHETYERLIASVSLDLKRYLYPSFEISRLTGLIGPRGVGKTTIMLQYIKENLYTDKKCFYFTADSVYFQGTTLLEYVNELYLNMGYKIFFIDEIHKYSNWSQELKNLYDAIPDMKIVFSGSSMLDIVKGSHDLSRRARIFHLPGMSFREYLYFVDKVIVEPFSFSELIQTPTKFNKIALIEKVKGHFNDYLARGYYPFVIDEPHTYYERVLRTVEKTIYEDIANFYNIKTPNLRLFHKILSYLASIPPGEVNTHNIAKNMGAADQTIDNFLSILQEVGLIQLVYPFEGGNQMLRKPQKIFLHNTTLFMAFQKFIGQPWSKGTLRELYFLQALRDSNVNIYYSKQADFRSEDILFEVGGKNKTRHQIKNQEKAFLVKDDILTSRKGEIPLLFFGFLY